MSKEPDGLNDQSLAVNQLIAEFQNRTGSGERLEVEQFINEHPEHAAELKQHFANVGQLEDFKKTAAPGNTETILKSDIDSDQSTDDASANTVVRGATDSETSVTRSFQEKTTSSATNLEIPETFGRYAIQKVLGQGAMGAVYLARDTQLDRDVALKIPKFGDSNGVDDEELLERFYREARASATLRSPNICPVYDVGEIDGQHYITMAYIEGRPLKDFTKSKKQHSEKQIITTIRKLATGLEQAHKIGVIHRDLKPANIMVDQQGEPVVMDFGLARRSSSDDVQVTQSGAILGTPAYMAPEQVAGDQAAIDHQVDIYALGIIMYELITGEMPFKGNLMALLQQIALNNPTRPTDLRPDLDPRLEKICLKMMAGDQQQRYQSMNDVAVALQDVLRHPNRKQKKEATKQTGPKPASIPSAKDESNPALISVAQPKSFSDQLRAKKSKTSKNTKSKSKSNSKSVDSGAGIPPKKMLLAGGLGGLILLLGIIFLVRIGKYEVQITLDDPSITLSVDDKVLNITDGQDVYKLSAGEHKLKLEKEGLSTHVEEFTVTKDGKTALRAVIVQGKLEGLVNGEKFPKPVRGGSLQPGNTPRDTNPKQATPAKESYALQFDSAADFVLLTGQSDELTTPFTVEMWLKTDPPSVEEPRGLRNHLTTFETQNGGFNIDIRYNWDHQPETAFLNFMYTDSDGIWMPGRVPGAEYSDDGWTHLAVVWNGTEFRTWTNGICRRDKVYSLTEKIPSRLSNVLGQLGGRTEMRRPFQGVIRELRLSTVSRYSGYSNFERPLLHKPFESDEHTLALYHFDEGSGDILKDSSGNGHDGKIIGAKWVRTGHTESAATAPDKVATNNPTPHGALTPTDGLEFDGRGDYVVMPTLTYDGSHPITVETWITPSNSMRAGAKILSTDDRDGNVDGFGLKWDGTESSWAFEAAYSLQGWVIPTVRVTEPGTKRIHLVGVIDDTHVTLFVNGKPVTKTAKDDRRFVPSKQPVTLGAIAPFDSVPDYAYFAGKMHAVRISKRVRYTEAFTPRQRFESDEDTLALYHFDEGSGDILKDSSGNGHHGKIIGAKWVRNEAPPESGINSTNTDFALEFEGGTNRVELPDLKLSNDQPFTIELTAHSHVDENVQQAWIWDMESFALAHLGGPSWNAGIRHSDSKKLMDHRYYSEVKRVRLAAVYDKNRITLFVDGKEVARKREVHVGQDRDVDPQPFLPFLPLKENQTYMLGASMYRSRGFTGLIDEIRVSNSARYQADYTPVDRFDTDAQTVALYHCDEGSGDILKDSSGNGLHGKIIGAKWVKDASLMASPVDGDPASIVRWMVQRGGHVRVLNKNGSSVLITSLNQPLPHLPFEISEVHLPRTTDNQQFAEYCDVIRKLNLANTHNIGTLSLQNAAITDEALKHLSGVALSALNLDGCKVTNEGIKNLALTKGVWEVKLGRTEINGNVAPLLCSIPKLNSVLLENIQIGDKCIQELCEFQSDWKAFSLSHTNITDASLKAMSGQSKLISLQLIGTSVTNEGFASLSNVPELNHLELSQTAVSDGLLSRLPNKLGLKRLNLDRTDLSEKGLRELGECPNLTWLELDGRGVNSETIQHILKLRELETLFMKASEVELDDVSKLQNLPKLKFLNIDNIPSLSRSDLDLLRKRLPKCKIDSDYGTFEPSGEPQM